jgi:bacillithiol biosynthesis cysteine-adding enzyme BshC
MITGMNVNPRTKLTPDQLPGMSRLAADYLGHSPHALAFFADDYSRSEAWPLQAGRVLRTEHANRSRLVEILRRQNRQLEAGPVTAASLDALASDDALVIVTGQQAGLFGGPLYTLYKALTTCKLARYWSGRLKKPVVPVFYLVSEDHDFAEVQGAGYLDTHHQYKKAVYAPSGLRERMPVGEILLDPGIDATMRELTEEIPDGDYKSGIVEMLAAGYSSGFSFAEAFSRWYARLLKERGMIFLDPSDPELKRLAAPLFRQELEQKITVQRMQEVNGRLQEAGYHLQLPVHPLRPALFLLRDGRHALEETTGGYRNLHTGEVLNLPELVALPEQLSPKAALRPLFQDYLLPTLAYVGGPGEIAYWGQLGGIYESFGLPMPLVIPRAGFTLVEGKSRRTLERFDIDVARLLQQPGEALARLREGLLPAHLSAGFARQKQSVVKSWPDLEGQIIALDPTLQTPAEKTLQQILHALTQLEQKVERAAELRQATVHAQLGALLEALLPGGVLQERQLNAVPFLCRHGLELIELLYQTIDETEPGHVVLAV